MKTNRFLSAAIFALAIAFTFSCSGGDDDGGGGTSSPSNGDSSSSITGGTSGGSSSPSCSPPSGGISGTYTDKRDNKTYKTTKICSQTWMAENLNYAVEGSKCYGEDGKIVSGTDDNDKTIYTTLSNAEIQANCNKYGRLYNWETANMACPSGWHLPDTTEWIILVVAVGGKETAGNYLKSKSGWYDARAWYDGNGEDKYGFSALPGGIGGYRSIGVNGDGDSYFIFESVGDLGDWWNSNEDSKNSYFAYGYAISIYKGNTNYHEYATKNSLLSVRCVQDN